MSEKLCDWCLTCLPSVVVVHGSEARRACALHLPQVRAVVCARELCYRSDLQIVPIAYWRGDDI